MPRCVNGKRVPLYLGCTKGRHKAIGVHAVINAAAGQQHLNERDNAPGHNGNRARKRAWEVRKRLVRCNNCGQSVGERANPNSSHNFCDASCARSYC